MISVRRLELNEVRITGGFWAGKIDMVAEEMLPYQWLALNDEVPGAEPSHAVENFRIAAGEASGDFMGNVWQDSDVAKWLEAASYSLSHHPDHELMAKVDEVIRLIAKAQLPDGYVNTYFIVAEPGKRWVDLAWGHELYCAGHLIEAAVAHEASTGKDSLLDVARRYADCIDRTFGAGEGQIRGVCGHPEIELALFRLYRATGEPRYRDLATFFVEERGRDPSSFDGKKPLAFQIAVTKWFGRDYFLNHERARAQADATGHAVRAVYLYAAMAEEYAATGDEELLRSLRRLWDSLVSRRMYVTGGIGSQGHGERFTADWDLPSDTAYAETCASIGLAFWASRMTEIEGDSRYADVLERVLYNGALSGVSLDGRRYFYVNPLEVIPGVVACRQDHEHVKGQRVQWLGCSCCPPNIARLVASAASYLYGVSDDAVWVHHYAESEAEVAVGGTRVTLSQRTEYPWSGAIALAVDPAQELEFSIKLRIPGWCGSFSCAVDGLPVAGRALSSGYLELRRLWKPGSRIELELAMEPRILYADTRIAELAGKAAVQRGPLVYCAESVDNGEDLHSLLLDPRASLRSAFDPEIMGGTVVVEASGYREAPRRDAARPGQGMPYGEAARPELKPTLIRMVPYHQWGNRAPGGEMRVWLRAKE
ncbi:MAG: beta-L-arabinofuranosidase domain-containing protein [Rectinemataceae bacterium]|jgi:hypothetical protein